MERHRDWWMPLTGILFVVLLIAGFIVIGDDPDPTEETAEEIMSFYEDNEGRVFGSSILLGLSAVSLLFFAGWLRRLLRDAEGAGGILSAVAFGGAVVIAVGFAAFGAMLIAAAEVAGDIDDPVVFQTLQALSWNFWVPIAVGTITFGLATGISIVRHGALPQWMGWVAIVAGVAMFSPAFIVAAPVLGLWIIAVSVIGAQRARAAGAGPGGA